MKVNCETCKKIFEVDITHDMNSGPVLSVYCSKKCWPRKLPTGRHVFLDHDPETDIYDENGDIKL